MYKPEVLAKFPKEVQDLAHRGVYSLFESKNDKSLLAKTPAGDCFKFDTRGGFTSMVSSSSIDFSGFVKLDLMSGEQILNILESASSGSYTEGKSRLFKA